MEKRIYMNPAIRQEVCKLLIQDKWGTANDIAKVYGFQEGITADFFERMIKLDGLTMAWIKAISVYYAQELKGVV